MSGKKGVLTLQTVVRNWILGSESSGFYIVSTSGPERFDFVTRCEDCGRFSEPQRNGKCPFLQDQSDREQKVKETHKMFICWLFGRSVNKEMNHKSSTWWFVDVLLTYLLYLNASCSKQTCSEKHFLKASLIISSYVLFIFILSLF